MTSPRCGPAGHGHHSAFGQVMYPTDHPSVPAKSSHQGLNDRSVALVDAKQAAEGTPLEKETTLARSAGLAAAYHDYAAHAAQIITLS